MNVHPDEVIEYTMDYETILAQLRSRKALIEDAILVFERMAMHAGIKRRGRPPAWTSSALLDETSIRSQPPKRQFSAEARQRMAEAQRRRWAEWREKNR